MTTLFDPTRIGDIGVANRIAMAPLTRNRAKPGQVPGPLAVEYYAQRASAGLIITEASQISQQGQGYIDTPGIFTPDQIAGWKRVTQAVHAKGGKIVIQLWHVGRVSHSSLQPEGGAPVSSVARIANAKTFLQGGFSATSAPRALALEELPGLVESYRQAAANAIEAGFDGVEVHAANGYLLEQFLRDSLNDRTDAYGGSIANRARLLLEVMRAVIDEIGAGRTGVRLSPVTPVNDIGQDSDPARLYGHVIDELAKQKAAFVHVIEGATGGPRDQQPFDFDALRKRFKSPHPAGGWIVNNGYTRETALDAVASGRADLVAFGKLFIANPDLVQRLRADAPMNALDQEHLYGGGAKGYTDYPTLSA